jgi:chromosome partitioning protein
MPPSKNSGFRPITISFLNRKGGVGKTSCCHHLGGAFAEKFRTLVVDCDPQCSLTQGLLGVKEALAVERGRSIAGLFDLRLDPSPADIIRPTKWKRLDLAVGSAVLDEYNLPRPETHVGLQRVLPDFLQEVRGSYDVILIDCPPNLNLCSWNALLASDFVVTPVQCEDYGSQGIAFASRFSDLARERGNPKLQPLGFVLTMVGRLTIHQAYRQQIRSLYKDAVFETEIPYLRDYKEAITYGMPVGQYKSQSPAAKVIRRLAEELLERAGACQELNEEKV